MCFIIREEGLPQERETYLNIFLPNLLQIVSKSFPENFCRYPLSIARGVMDFEKFRIWGGRAAAAWSKIF